MLSTNSAHELCMDYYGNDCVPLNVVATPTQPTCGLNNGSISVTPGPGGHTYMWTGGLSGPNPMNVPPGSYTVTVTNTSTAAAGAVRREARRISCKFANRNLHLDFATLLLL